MKKNWLQTHPERWLVAGVLALAILTLAFQGGDGNVDSAHYPRPTKTPTVTSTPTLTPTPPPQACQVQEIFFDEQFYTSGTTITATVGVPLQVTLRVADVQGAPLIGANVDATVTQTTTVQAAAVPPLEDQSGTYDGIYTPENVGLYIIKFSVSDFTGPRFLPCQAEAKILVVPPQVTPQCQINLETIPSGKQEYQLNEPITVTAKVSVNGAERCNAKVSGFIRKIPNGTPTPIPFPDNCPYIASFPGTSITGTYAITAFAEDRNNGKDFIQCTSPERTSTVVPTPTPITPTPTPTPTVSINLTESKIELCGRANPDTASQIVAGGVSNLTEVDLIITYDPTFIIPSKITRIFAFGSISQTRKTIHYTARRNNPVGGVVDLLAIDWRLQGRAGITTITLTSNLKNVNGTPIQPTIENSTLEITIGAPCRVGAVALQGRTDHSGVIITNATGEQAQTYASGLFAIALQGPLKFNFPGYLSEQVDLSPNAAGQAVSLGSFTLLAGDVNNDSIIDILDLATLAQHYQSTDPATDLNADGIVDILDLALIATNYQRQGP